VLTRTFLRLTRLCAARTPTFRCLLPLLRAARLRFSGTLPALCAHSHCALRHVCACFPLTRTYNACAALRAFLRRGACCRPSNLRAAAARAAEKKKKEKKRRTVG